MENAAALIDERTGWLGDWRGKMLAHVRVLIHRVNTEIVEQWKWRGVPVWSRGATICTGETYKSAVKLTVAEGAALQDPAGLFNASLEGNVRRAIHIQEGGALLKAAFEELIRAAVALNAMRKAKAQA